MKLEQCQQPAAVGRPGEMMDDSRQATDGALEQQVGLSLRSPTTTQPPTDPFPPACLLRCEVWSQPALSRGLLGFASSAQPTADLLGKLCYEADL